MTFTLWLIGFLFTLGFTLSSFLASAPPSKLRTILGVVAFVMICICLWPFILGAWLAPED